LIQLINGRMVESDADKWRNECLARHVLSKPLDDRRLWLADFEKKHGQAEADKLKAAMTAIYAGRQMP
jgi:hypothetical protein